MNLARSVLDASAILAFLKGEPGADRVEDALVDRATASAVNIAEVAQKVVHKGGDWTASRALLEAYDFTISAATSEDAEWAALRWRPGQDLSLADRFCLALGVRLDLPTFTADRAWGDSDTVIQIR